MAIFVYSSAANALQYSLKSGTVIIRGGSGVQSRRHLYTPHGIATRITEAQRDELLKIPSVQKRIKHGFLKFDNREFHGEDVGKGLSKDDKSKQKKDTEIKKKTGAKKA